MFDDVERAIRDELRPNEDLLWAARPCQGVRLRAADAFMIPFSLLWGGFAIFWEATVILHGAPLFFALFGVPFIVMGLYVVFGRFWFDAWQRSRIFYGLTDSRVIILSGIFSRQTRSLNVRTLADLTLTTKRDGSGTISFGPVNPMHAWWAGSGWPGMGRYAAPCLELDGDAAQVYEKILAVQKLANVPT